MSFYALGELDLEHRQPGTSHSVLPSLQKVSGNSGDDYDVVYYGASGDYDVVDYDDAFESETPGPSSSTSTDEFKM